jgi:NADH-quinone oxidoreductase subunit J
MDPILPYIATAVGAIGLLIVLSARTAPVRGFGGLIGLAGLAWLFVLAGSVPEGIQDAVEEGFFLVFALMAVASAVQMISQRRPVYAALFFVLVVMSVCGVLVMLEAFFMAFALVIVYAGAILITYMFVLMLAQQATDTEHTGEIPQYDREPRDPRAAVLIAAMFMATVVAAAFTGLDDLAPAGDTQTRLQADASLLRSLPKQVERMAAKSNGFIPNTDLASALRIDGDALVLAGTNADGVAATIVLSPPGNTSHVGWSLVASFPASLELAGVILLMAMFGAVVLARRQVDHAEQELAEAMGVGRGDYGESREADE